MDFIYRLQLLAEHLPSLAIRLRHRQYLEEDRSFSCVEQFDFKDYNILYIYGLNCFRSLLPYLEKLKKNQKIVFIDDDEKNFVFFLQDSQSKLFLESPQVHFFSFTYKYEINCLAKQLAWDFCFQSVYFYAVPSKKEYTEMLKERIYYENVSKNISVYTVLDPDFEYFSAPLHNLKSLKIAKNGHQLETAFRGIPAVICGAGPSLKQIKSKLPKLLKHTLVIGVGAGINCLNRWNLQPHFGVALDPDEIQEDYILARKDFELPYLYRYSFYERALKHIHGPKLYIKGTSNQEMIDEIDTDLGLEEKSLAGGFSTTTFAARLAVLWGCSPIILLGIDLAYEEEHKYADHVSTLAPDKNSEISDPGIHWNTLIQDVDKNGKACSTTWGWKSEALWFEDFILKNPAIEWINASEGGLSIKGMKECSIDTLQFRDRPYRDLVHSRQTSCQSLKFRYDKLEQTICSWIEEAKTCLELIENYLDHLSEIGRNKGILQFIQFELEENKVFKYFLKLKSKVFRQLVKNSGEELTDLEKSLKNALYLRKSCIKLIELLELQLPIAKNQMCSKS